ncbi:hypothetical protein R3W88_024613 [Solanum pinnatisectum]|uniref:Uncharacterized protein n=1 Tax=Solanum pinnatisectum TaxID=50273 RepID=A0AAV9M3T7_9SOLN|nr:hypothetical protein R3W88_024613 [Solanum pinnatisectum]
MGESGLVFNTRPSENHLNNEDPVATFSTSPSFTTTPPFTATPPFNTVTADGATDDDIDVDPAGPDFPEEVEGSNYSTEDSVESEAELVGDDDEEEYGSDVHEEVRELRAEKRSFQRRKRRERLTSDNEERGCPQREGVESSTRQSAPSPTVEPTGSGRGRGKPKKTPSAPSEGEPPLKKGRGRPKKPSSVAPSAPTDFPATTSAPPTYHASSSIAGTTKRGRGRGRGNTSLEKRPRVMGIGVFQTANGFKPGMPSSKIYSTGQAKVKRSSNVTGDISYTPTSFMSLERSKERRQWEVVQVKMSLLHSQRCHENCSDVDVFKHF